MNRLKYNTFLKTDESLKNKVDFILEGFFISFNLLRLLSL